MTVLLAGSLVSIACGAGAAQAPEKPATLKLGDRAPDFQIAPPGPEKERDPGLRLSDFRGKKNVLVAFYPKPFTPGCTAQMCGYRDDFARFENAGTEVVAVSVDTQAECNRFKDEKQLPFRLVGDLDARIVKAYGVPLLDLPVGHVAKRSVFLVDKAGVIRYIDLAYDVENGKGPLYEALGKLQTPTSK
jgi:peroxiredoxin Q/BCP